jgi:hypothetical protein
VDAYLRRLGRRLWVVPHRRSRVLREARDHLLAATEGGIARGLTPADAEAQAVARFGPAGRLTRHEIREAGALWASVVAGLAALTVSLMVLASRADVRPLFDYHAGNYGSLHNNQPNRFSHYRPYQFQPWAISAAPQSDAWIVGAPARVAWHWNGTSWEKTAMAAPPPRDYPGYRKRQHHPGPTEAGFTAVATPAPGDAWAVGWEGPPNDYGNVYLTQPLIEHWDGQAWHVSLSVGGQGQLTDVAAPAPHDVWAIGSRLRKHHGHPRQYQSMIEHWDGHAWHLLTPSWLPTGAALTMVSASSGSDVWMQAEHHSRGLLEHWDGHTWSQVAEPFGADSLVSSLASTSWTDAWAVASYSRHSHDHPIAAHWDGNHWAITPTPHHNTDSALFDVITASPTDAWAVGASARFHPQGRPACAWCGAGGYGNVPGVYYIHWDGKRWSNSPAARITLNGEKLAVAPDGAAFGVGTCIGRQAPDTAFIVRLDGSKWTQQRIPQHAPGHATSTPAAQACSLAQMRRPQPPAKSSN